MSTRYPILITGAAGKIGGVGHSIVELLCKKDLAVRAFVHRKDERSEELAAIGAQVFVGDLTKPTDVLSALKDCRRMYFGMSVSPSYLEATMVAAVAAKQQNNFEVLVNISQMTVSQMDFENMTDSPQQKQHWLAEQVLNWSGLPVVHIRSTVFLEHFFFSQWAASSIAKDGTIKLPFGSASTSPVAVQDVAEVITTILENPDKHIGKIYELTGQKSQNMDAIAKEYAEALGHPVKYVDISLDEWREKQLSKSGLPDHVAKHIDTMARLHKANRYDRMTNDVEKIIGRPATSIKDYIIEHKDLFTNSKVLNQGMKKRMS